MVPQGLPLATRSQPGLNPRPASRRLSVYVRGPDKMATSTTTPKGKCTESLTFSTPNCICADYGKLGKPSLHQPYIEGESILAITDHTALTWSKTFQNVYLGYCICRLSETSNCPLSQSFSF